MGRAYFAKIRFSANWPRWTIVQLGHISLNHEDFSVSIAPARFGPICSGCDRLKQDFPHSGLLHRWPQRGRSCGAMSEPLQRIGEPLRSAKAARPQRSEARSARPRQSVYQGLGQAVPGRAERRTISIHAPCKRLLPWQQPRPLRGKSEGGSRAASAAPKAAQQKKAPGEVQTPPLRGLFWSRHRLAVTAPVLYHTFPASSIPPPPRQNSGPSPRGGRWVGLSLAPALPTTAALRSKPPTTHAQQKIAARELTKRAGRGIITARSRISLNMRLLAQI